MQLKKRSPIAEKLALAAALLLGTQAQAETGEDDWDFVGSVLVYNEPDRVSAVEAILTADKNFSETASLTYKVVLDSLTGASANGAIVQNNVQTFTRPSGNGQYVIQAMDTPLDDTFKDTRVQFNVNWTDALTDDMRYTLGSNLSKEYDFTSITINGGLEKDFNQKNTTLSAGISYAAESVEPEGGIPLAFASMVIDQGQFVDPADYITAFDATRISGDDSIDSAELLLGWTQIINRRSLMQFNYGYSDSSGYLTDPFKILSSINQNAETQALVYEKRPNSRSQHSFFSLYKYHFDESIIDFSYRYTQDDWEIDSHTLDLRWHLFAGDNSFWEPHVRYYQQSAADFYYPYLVDDQVLPEFASADYRIGEMTSITLGIKYGFIMGDNRAEIRAEYYRQTPQATGSEAVVAAGDLDLYPEVDAMMLQFSYYF